MVRSQQWNDLWYSNNKGLPLITVYLSLLNAQYSCLTCFLLLISDIEVSNRKTVVPVKAAFQLIRYVPE